MRTNSWSIVSYRAILLLTVTIYYELQGDTFNVSNAVSISSDDDVLQVLMGMDSKYGDVYLDLVDQVRQVIAKRAEG